MSYLRGDNYIWSDGDSVHFWSTTGLDHCRESGRFSECETASGVALSNEITNAFVLMRFAELIRFGELEQALDKTLSEHCGNFGSEALIDLAQAIRDFSAKIDLPKLARLEQLGEWKELE